MTLEKTLTGVETQKNLLQHEPVDIAFYPLVDNPVQDLVTAPNSEATSHAASKSPLGTPIKESEAKRLKLRCL